MALAVDASGRQTMIRREDPIGGYLAADSNAGWHRLMPVVQARAVENDEFVLDFNTGFRDDILDVTGWNVMILTPGFFDINNIQSVSGNIARLANPLRPHAGVLELGTNLRVVIYPVLDLPLGITYNPDAASSELMIGVAKENVLSPTPKQFALLEAGQMIVMHTRQIQKIYYQGAASGDRISWGEHYIA